MLDFGYQHHALVIVNVLLHVPIARPALGVQEWCQMHQLIAAPLCGGQSEAAPWSIAIAIVCVCVCVCVCVRLCVLFPRADRYCIKGIIILS